MASPRHHHRRGSMDEPLNLSSDITHLSQELNRLHKDYSPECNKHMETITTLFNELKEVYRRSACSSIAGARVGGFGAAVLFVGFALFVFNAELSIIVAGAGAGMAIAGGFRVAFERYKKTQQKKNLNRSIEEALKGIEDKSSTIIDIMEKIGQCTEEILRDALLTDHKAQALSEHFAYCFEKRNLFQEHGSSKVGDRMSKIVHLSGNLSEMIAKVSSVPEILKEIIKDNKRQHDKPTHEQINKMELKEKAEKCINDMRNSICQLKKRLKEIRQKTERISEL